MGGISPLGPNQKDNSSTKHCQALQPQLAVGLAVVFHRDHWEIECASKVYKVIFVFLEIAGTLRLIPSDQYL